MAADVATVGAAAVGLALCWRRWYRRERERMREAKITAEPADAEAPCAAATAEPADAEAPRAAAAAAAADESGTAANVVWQIWLGGRYKPYEPAVSKVLEAAFLGGQDEAKFVIRCNGHDIEHRVTSLQGTTITQAPVDRPGGKRSVRRISTDPISTSTSPRPPLPSIFELVLYPFAKLVTIVANGFIGIVILKDATFPQSLLVSAPLILTSLVALGVSSSPRGARTPYSWEIDLGKKILQTICPNIV